MMNPALEVLNSDALEGLRTFGRFDFKPAHLYRPRMWLLALALGSIWSALVLAPVNAQTGQVLLPRKDDFGHHRERVEDLKLRVAHGFIRAAREWRGEDRGWVFFPEWDEQFRLDVLAPDGFPVAIWRGSSQYVRRGATALEWYSVGARIRYVDGVYHWRDQSGAWVEFDELGLVNRFGVSSMSGAGSVTLGVIPRDSNGRLTGIDDPDGLSWIAVERDGMGNIDEIRDYSGRSVQYSYENGNLISVTDVRGFSTSYSYGDGNRLDSITHPSGRVESIVYSDNGMLHSILDQDGVGAEYRFEVDAASGLKYSWRRDTSGRVVEAWQKGSRTVRRDVNGSMIERTKVDGETVIVIDTNGNETRHVSGLNGRRRSITFPDGSTRTRWYNSQSSRMSWFEDENGINIAYHYGPLGGGRTQMLAIHAPGYPEERRTLLELDSYWRVLSRREEVDGGLGDYVSTYSYDAFGNVATETDSEGSVTAYEYDVQGNVTRKVDARGFEWFYEYDAAGNLIRTEDPLGNEITLEYDGMGNLVQATDAVGAVAQYVYNRQGLLVEHGDALGRVWRFEYDLGGRMVRFLRANLYLE